MAVTKFLTKKTRLDTIIKYIINGEKTEKMMYVSGVNCRPDTAIYEMQDTNKRFDKEDGIISYHLIQSFIFRTYFFYTILLNHIYLLINNQLKLITSLYYLLYYS